MGESHPSTHDQGILVGVREDAFRRERGKFLGENPPVFPNGWLENPYPIASVYAMFTKIWLIICGGCR